MCIVGFAKAPFYVRNNSYLESKHRGTSTIGIIFDSRMFVIDLNGLKSNLTTALSFWDMSSCVWSTSIYCWPTQFSLSWFWWIFARLFIRSFPTWRAQRPFSLMTCQISAKQKDDINTTKTKLARKHLNIKLYNKQKYKFKLCSWWTIDRNHPINSRECENWVTNQGRNPNFNSEFDR